MVDPNRKINRLSDDDAAFLIECEQEFRNRYTENDSEFAAFCAKPLRSPPIIEPWHSPKRHNDNRNWHRNNRPYNNHHNRNHYDRHQQNRFERNQKHFKRHQNYERYRNDANQHATSSRPNVPYKN